MLSFGSCLNEKPNSTSGGKYWPLVCLKLVYCNLEKWSWVAWWPQTSPSPKRHLFEIPAASVCFVLCCYLPPSHLGFLTFESHLLAQISFKKWLFAGSRVSSYCPPQESRLLANLSSAFILLHQRSSVGEVQLIRIACMLLSKNLTAEGSQILVS